MAAINPYLNFDGKTEKIFNFYKSVADSRYGILDISVKRTILRGYCNRETFKTRSNNSI